MTEEGVGVALDRQVILDQAFAILRDQGLSALTMRHLATELGVAPGALYWHVASKQELVASVAELILTRGPRQIRTTDPRTAALDLRDALLAVRDGADVVSFALALHPDHLEPLSRIAQAFAGLTQEQSRWAARAMTHYVLGATAEDQNRNELIRAGILTESSRPGDSDVSFEFALAAIIDGLKNVRPG